MNVKKLKIIAAIIVVSVVILTWLLPSCGVHEQESGIKSLDELAQHGDVISLQEYEAYEDELFETEIWCIDLRAYYNEFVEYPNAATRPRLYADEVNWYSIRYQSGEEEVNGYIAAPADYLEKDYPILIYNRGGYAGDELRTSDVQYFARFGFIVLASKFRGSGGSTGKDGFGGEDVNDVIKLIDLAEEFTFTNGKIYMFGWSRGATQTYIVLSRDDRIDAAVAGAGPADVSEFYYEIEYYQQDKLSTMIGGTPETHPEEYEARSAVCWPEKINTPLWIVHGTADDIVPVHHSEDLFNAFVAVGEDAKFTLFPEMDHGDPGWAFLPDYFYWLRQH